MRHILLHLGVGHVVLRRGHVILLLRLKATLVLHLPTLLLHVVVTLVVGPLVVGVRLGSVLWWLLLELLLLQWRCLRNCRLKATCLRLQVETWNRNIEIWSKCRGRSRKTLWLASKEIGVNQMNRIGC